ncbi:hypothetical protein DFJ74DRAFT_448138 [Hyaloraphidium curvatum]|nr:hypothetical protein DFJ74DRAFT_448138 [Hyaloraphidium curvatum]
MANATVLSAAVPGALPPHLLADTWWAALGRRWLSYAVPIHDALGGCLTFTLYSFVFLWANWIPIYGFFRAVDKYNFLGLQRYKQHPGRYEPQTLNDKVVTGVRYGFWRGAIRNAVFYWVWFSHGRMDMRVWPKSPVKVALDVLFGFVLNDFLFYWAHRAMHHPRLYKHLHKQHHEFKVTNVGATAWNEASESFLIMILANTVAWSLSMDLFTWCMWIILQNYYDHYVHSGYAFWFDPGQLLVDPQFHDWHHFANAGNYSVTSIWDVAFGTDLNFRAWKIRQEERRLKGLQEEPERRDDGDDTGASSGYVGFDEAKAKSG